jgi:hypothetical protein
MTTAKRRRPHDKVSKLTRTEVVTIRLTPRMRYLLELVAREQRRTVSSVMECAFEQASSDWTVKVFFTDQTYALQQNLPLRDAEILLWDVDEVERFVKLALHCPHLLNYDEEMLWKCIENCDEIWRVDRVARLPFNIAETMNALDFPALRARWATLLKQVAEQTTLHGLPRPALQPVPLRTTSR